MSTAKLGIRARHKILKNQLEYADKLIALLERAIRHGYGVEMLRIADEENVDLILATCILYSETVCGFLVRGQ